MRKPNTIKDARSLRDTREFIWLSDIHYDPYYGQAPAVGHCNATMSPKYGQRECDSPKALVQSALSQMAKAISPADFILITGDFFRHESDKLVDSVNQMTTVLANLSNIIRFVFPENMSIIPCIGNNDVTPDYYLDIANASETLNTLTQAFLPFLREEEIPTFSRGGYLARNVTDRLTILSLNTIVYSSNHNPESQSTIKDPFDQFEWLQSQLEIARSSERAVYISGHISPSIGSYRLKQLWRESYLRKYYLIVNKYEDIIAGQLFGHIHSDEFRLTSSKTPLLLAPSLTPIFGNNPSFRRVYYTAAGEIFDYDTYYLDVENNQTWMQAPSFREAFSLPDMTYDSLRHILDNFERVWKTFLTRQHTYNMELVPEECDKDCQKDWKCILTSISRKGYDDCVSNNGEEDKKSVPSTARITLVAGLLVASVVLLVIIVILAKRWVGKRHYRLKVAETDAGLSLPEIS
mmetsp:Transcript_11244/g.16523  ORF Transcript_11244/g.16523 Transcript_11244/m.16523 type:complete len:464 (+) Transcript_11244:206-1597(+)